MVIEVKQESISALPEYAAILTAFEVREVFDVTAGAQDNAPFMLTQRPLRVSYTKDYDAVSGEAPTQWGQRFDVSKWGFFSAFTNGERVGGATVAYDTPGLEMLEGRLDLAVLWDIRVAHEARRRGVGTALFETAARWAFAKGCRQLKVETQNINVAACRFYAQQGCILRAVSRDAYSGLPDEIQFFWYKDLTDGLTAG